MSTSLIDVSNLLKPIANLIDNLHTSKEEKAALEIAFYNAQVEAAKNFAGFQRDIITKEMDGQSPVQRNWRPHLMYVFIFILAWNFILSKLLTWLGSLAIVTFHLDPSLTSQLIVPVLEVPDKMWTLLTFGVTGYIGLRSALDKGGLARLFESKKNKEE